MTFTVQIDVARWREHHKHVLADLPGLVPVAKGNGYGVGNARLAQECAVLGVDTMAVGTDREDYPRNLYSPHPVLSGVITRTGLAACALVVNAICLAIMITLTVERGWPIIAFALAGFVSSVEGKTSLRL